MANDSSERFVLLNRLADEFAARYRSGERPSLKEYIDRHPELADDIRDFFPTLVEMEQVKDDRQAPPEQAATHTLPAPERLGDFRIIREIGRGGMGVVYEAEQVSLGRRVALKVLPKQLLADAKTKRRFEREARAAAKLHHTNIVPVFGVGEHEGLPYYVMQFIRGLGLDEVLEELQRLQPGNPGSGSIQRLTAGELRVARKDLSAADVARSLLTGRLTLPPDQENGVAATRPDVTDAYEAKAPADPTPPVENPGAGRLSDTFTLSGSSVVLPGTGRQSGQKPLTYWQSVARIGIQVADALEYAHRQGILHRDTKPSNLLLDTTGTVWVTDFGLAKASDQQDLTGTGDILGTLRYMPPEAFDGRSDARGDVYALGLTLYELLALRPAFDEKERNRLIKQVTSAEPARLDRLNQDVPRDLVTIVHKAIERDPGRRYPSAADLEADLKRFLDDEPIQARRQTQVERYVRWARHNPGIAVLGGVLTAVLVLVTVASLLAAGYFNRLRLSEAQAAQNERDAREAEARQRQIAEDKTKEAKAAGLVQLALNVDTPKLPPVIEQMAEYRQWTDPLLREIPDRSPQRLNASLALLPVDPGQVDYLYGRLLDADPRDVFPVIRDALAPHKDRLLDRLWAVVEKTEQNMASQRLRAAAALAKYDPESERWSKRRPVTSVFLSTLQERNVQVDRSGAAAAAGSFRKDRTIAGFPGVRQEIIVDGALRPYSLFTHPPRNGFASFSYDLDRPYTQFLAKVGIPALVPIQEDPYAPLTFEILGNGKSIWKSKPLTKRGEILDCQIGLAGVNQLELRVNAAGATNYAWAFWLDPRLTGTGLFRITQSSVVNDLVAVPADQLTAWKDALRPVRFKLLAPLSAVYRNANRPADRALAADILADYAADQPRLLADLLLNADEKQFGVIYPKFRVFGEQDLPLLVSEIEKNLPPDLPSSDRSREELAKRRVNAAVALLRMGQTEKAWPLLKHSLDPRVRSYLIHAQSPLGVDAKTIVKRLDTEPDVTIRRALLLSLGEYGDKVTPEDRRALLPKLQEMYRTAPDAGLHAAAEWLLRQWKVDDWLAKTNQAWADDKQQGGKRLETIGQELKKEPGTDGARWYVNGQGQAMVVIPGPLEFWMGSPPSETGHERFAGSLPELRHWRRIGRSFAIASKEVTVDQFLRFRKDHPVDQRAAPAPDCPVNNVSWYDAAAYCNWLSEQEGIPKDQWCYEPNAQRNYDQGMKLAPNYLQRAGYRLPTEAEWEFACRAGAVTQYSFGESDELLERYAWDLRNWQGQLRPVGTLKPNDLGLFDMHGNVWEWCQEESKEYPRGVDGKAAEDTEDLVDPANNRRRILRGGVFDQMGPERSAARGGNSPSARIWRNGLRPVRTLPFRRLDRLAAARAAALAAAGKGADQPPLGDAGKANLRRHALDWLKAELTDWNKVQPPRLFLARNMWQWQQDRDLAGIRDQAALANLPAEEQKAFSQFWTDVAKAAEPADGAERLEFARVAVLMAAGQDKSDPPFDDAARAQLGQKALAWLKAELAATADRTGKAKVIAAAAPLPGLLEQLAELAPHDGPFQAELARSYAEHGDLQRADRAGSKARALLEAQLAKEPDKAALAEILADVLRTASGTKRIVRARFVRLDLPGENRTINLAELQVFHGDQNIALRKKAQQSSTFSGGQHAENAVDGDTVGDDRGHPYAHTGFENDPWWEVDLGTEQAINRIVVWNRSEGNGIFYARMNHFRVQVLDSSRNVVFEQVVEKAPDPRAEIVLPPPSKLADPWLRLAEAYALNGRNDKATEYFAKAFQAKPKLGDDRQAQHRYHAAGAALRAAVGQGQDMPPLDDAARAKLRRQALDWLKAELTAWTKQLEAPAKQEYVGIDDEIPAGAKSHVEDFTTTGTLFRLGEAWTWVTRPNHPVFSGNRASMQTAEALSQHSFEDAPVGLKVGAGDTLFAYVYLDPARRPREIMLQWSTGKGDWSHRAHWGDDLISWAPRARMGPLPEAGKWVRLEVEAAKVGLQPGMMISGWAFTQYGGTVYWDKAGIVSQTTQAESVPPEIIVRTLSAWRTDPDLAGVRDAAALAKLPADEQKEWHLLWAQVPELTPMVPTSQEKGRRWHYTTDRPPDGWQKLDFDDKAWKQGIGAFGFFADADKPGRPGVLLHTEWNTPDIWLRREFTMPEGAWDDLLLLLTHHDDAEVYINGVLALKAPGCAFVYEEMPLGAEARKALKAGKNVLAVHSHNVSGPQHIDAGIVAVKGNLARLALAQVAYDRKRYGLATQLWAAALASDPALGDRKAGLRASAARAAALAAAGQANDEPPPDDTAKAKLRGLAIDWLKADLAKDPDNAAVLTELATAFQSAGRTQEALPYLVRMSAADPKDTILFMKVAALQAWFGQDKELAATRQRIRAFAKDTKEDVVTTAERAAKVCSIRAAADKAELDAALALARKGVELGERGGLREWRLLALGMAEYRSGNYAAADEALLTAVKAIPPDNPPTTYIVTGTAAFYRTMSLFQQGKKDEARKLAIEATAKIKPLPTDENNPLSVDADHDDLILWLAYKEAKALIGFDAAPPPKGENDKK